MRAGKGVRGSRPSELDRAWLALERELAATLSQLGEGEWQYLILSDQRTARYVQFAVYAESLLRAEAVSSDFLPETHELGQAEEAALEKAGWRPPGTQGTEGGAAPRRPGNYYRNFPRPVDYGAVASLAISTMRDIFQTPHPARLEYQAFERGGAGIIVPGLQLVRRRPAPAPKAPDRPPDLDAMRRRLLEALREAAGDPNLELDADGDIPVRYNSAAVYVRARQQPPCVLLFSPLLSRVEHREGVVERLNELNTRIKFARLFESKGTIWAAIELFAAPFVVEHVVEACRYLGALADDMGGALQAQFGGRTTFGEFREKSLKNEEAP